MKKTTFLALLILPLIVSSQNWQPVNPGQVSFYSNDNSGLMDHTVMIDSVFGVSGQQVYYLNRSIKRCDTCITPVPCYGVGGDFYLNNLQGIFAKQVYQIEQGKYWFYDSVSFVLLTRSAPGISWLFDTTANITAEITGVNLQEIFSGVFDSTKHIELSNGKEILLSKNYGIIKFPSSLEDVDYFNLAGLENGSDTLGITPPVFFEIFDIEVGDVFQYSGEDANYSWPPPNSDFYTLKKKVVSVNKTANSVSIGWDIIKRHLMFGTVITDSYEETYYNEPEFLALQLPGTLFNLCSDEQSFLYLCDDFNNVHSEVRHQSTPILNQVKAIGNYQTSEYWEMSPMLTQCENGSPIMVDFSSMELFGVSKAYAPGLGLVRSKVQIFEYLDRFDIAGYVKDGDTIGTITPDDILLDVDEILTKPAISIFPNPAREKVLLNISEECEMQIFDIKGQLKFTEVFVEPISEIKLRDFIPGIYFVKIVSGQNSYTQKLIVE